MQPLTPERIAQSNLADLLIECPLLESALLEAGIEFDPDERTTLAEKLAQWSALRRQSNSQTFPPCPQWLHRKSAFASSETAGFANVLRHCGQRGGLRLPPCTNCGEPNMPLMRITVASSFSPNVTCGEQPR